MQRLSLGRLWQWTNSRKSDLKLWINNSPEGHFIIQSARFKIFFLSIPEWLIQLTSSVCPGLLPVSYLARDTGDLGVTSRCHHHQTPQDQPEARQVEVGCLHHHSVTIHGSLWDRKRGLIVHTRSRITLQMGSANERHHNVIFHLLSPHTEWSL